MGFHQAHFAFVTILKIDLGEQKVIGAFRLKLSLRGVSSVLRPILQQRHLNLHHAIGVSSSTIMQYLS